VIIGQAVVMNELSSPLIITTETMCPQCLDVGEVCPCADGLWTRSDAQINYILLTSDSASSRGARKRVSFQRAGVGSVQLCANIIFQWFDFMRALRQTQLQILQFFK
jgi:hypothetical protein